MLRQLYLSVHSSVRKIWCAVGTLKRLNRRWHLFWKRYVAELVQNCKPLLGARQSPRSGVRRWILRRELRALLFTWTEWSFRLRNLQFAPCTVSKSRAVIEPKSNFNACDIYLQNQYMAPDILVNGFYRRVFTRIFPVRFLNPWNRPMRDWQSHGHTDFNEAFSSHSCVGLHFTGPPTHSVGGQYCFDRRASVVVCRLSAFVTLHGAT